MAILQLSTKDATIVAGGMPDPTGNLDIIYGPWGPYALIPLKMLNAAQAEFRPIFNPPVTGVIVGAIGSVVSLLGNLLAGISQTLGGLRL